MVTYHIQSVLQKSNNSNNYDRRCLMWSLWAGIYMITISKRYQKPNSLFDWISQIPICRDMLQPPKSDIIIWLTTLSTLSTILISNILTEVNVTVSCVSTYCQKVAKLLVQMMKKLIWFCGLCSLQS